VLTTFKGCVMVAGQKCARLETELDMDVVPNPGTEGPQGKWQGKGTALYNLDRRLFVTSSVSMNTVTSRQGESFKMAQIQRFVAQLQP
jgi:hypothetical protein